MVHRKVAEGDAKRPEFRLYARKRQQTRRMEKSPAQVAKSEASEQSSVFRTGWLDAEYGRQNIIIVVKDVDGNTGIDGEDLCGVNVAAICAARGCSADSLHKTLGKRYYFCPITQQHITHLAGTDYEISNTPQGPTFVNAGAAVGTMRSGSIATAQAQARAQAQEVSATIVSVSALYRKAINDALAALEPTITQTGSGATVSAAIIATLDIIQDMLMAPQPQQSASAPAAPSSLAPAHVPSGRAAPRRDASSSSCDEDEEYEDKKKSKAKAKPASKAKSKDAASGQIVPAAAAAATTTTTTAISTTAMPGGKALLRTDIALSHVFDMGDEGSADERSGAAADAARGRLRDRVQAERTDVRSRSSSPRHAMAEPLGATFQGLVYNPLDDPSAAVLDIPATTTSAFAVHATALQPVSDGFYYYNSSCNSQVVPYMTYPGDLSGPMDSGAQLSMPADDCLQIPGNPVCDPMMMLLQDTVSDVDSLIPVW